MNRLYKMIYKRVPLMKIKIHLKYKILASFLALFFNHPALSVAQQPIEILDQTKPQAKSYKTGQGMAEPNEVPHAFEDFLDGRTLSPFVNETVSDQKVINESVGEEKEKNHFFAALSKEQQHLVEAAVAEALTASTFFYEVEENKMYQSFVMLERVTAIVSDEIHKSRSHSLKAPMRSEIKAFEPVTAAPVEKIMTETEPETIMPGREPSFAAPAAEFDSAVVMLENEVGGPPAGEAPEFILTKKAEREIFFSPELNRIVAEVSAGASIVDQPKQKQEAVEQLYKVFEAYMERAHAESVSVQKPEVDQLIQDFTQLLYQAAERVREIYLPGYKAVANRYSGQKDNHREARVAGIIGAVSPSPDKKIRTAAVQSIQQFMPGLKGEELSVRSFTNIDSDDETTADLYILMQEYMKNHMYSDRQHPYIEWLLEIAKINYSRKMAEKLIKDDREIRQSDEDDRKRQVLNAILKGKTPIFSTRMTSLLPGPGIAGSKSVTDSSVSETGKPQL